MPTQSLAGERVAPVAGLEGCRVLDADTGGEQTRPSSLVHDGNPTTEPVPAARTPPSTPEHPERCPSRRRVRRPVAVRRTSTAAGSASVDLGLIASGLRWVTTGDIPVSTFTTGEQLPDDRLVVSSRPTSPGPSTSPRSGSGCATPSHDPNDTAWAMS